MTMEDMAGGTFTISNGGVFGMQQHISISLVYIDVTGLGSLMGTPIINPPQSAILGMHATKPRPGLFFRRRLFCVLFLIFPHKSKTLVSS
jgi:2-oxoglutarate dehydrogenase E2 component (dihydrolipoamide succinyltransferase)